MLNLSWYKKYGSISSIRSSQHRILIKQKLGERNTREPKTEIYLLIAVGDDSTMAISTSSRNDSIRWNTATVTSLVIMSEFAAREIISAKPSSGTVFPPPTELELTTNAIAIARFNVRDDVRQEPKSPSFICDKTIK